MKFSDITDGASRTYLIGEKYLSPDSYYNGTAPDDNNGICVGYDWDFQRWTARSHFRRFPASHAGRARCLERLHLRQRPRVNFQYGLLRRLGAFGQLSIDARVHELLGSRADGVPINERLVP